MLSLSSGTSFGGEGWPGGTAAGCSSSCQVSVAAKLSVEVSAVSPSTAPSSRARAAPRRRLAGAGGAKRAAAAGLQVPILGQGGWIPEASADER